MEQGCKGSTRRHRHTHISSSFDPSAHRALRGFVLGDPLSKFSFTLTPSTDWFTIEESARIFGLTPKRLLELVQSGKLRGRQMNGELRIDSNSLDRYCHSNPVPVAAPTPRTFVKVGGRAYEEVQTASGVTLIPPFCA